MASQQNQFETKVEQEHEAATARYDRLSNLAKRMNEDSDQANEEGTCQIVIYDKINDKILPLIGKILCGLHNGEVGQANTYYSGQYELDKSKLARLCYNLHFMFKSNPYVHNEIKQRLEKLAINAQVYTKPLVGETNLAICMLLASELLGIIEI